MSGMGSYNSTILAGQGRMEQSGGTHTANNLFVGYSTGSTGVYNLSAGAVSAVNEYVGYSGQGSFNQTGGSNILSDTLLIGSQGVYNLGGGVLNAGSVVNNGTFNYSGGQLNSGAIINNVGGNFNFNDANFNVSGDVTNYGTVKTNNATVNFTGTFTNYGAYISDPSSNYFSNIVVGADGYLVGGIGDNFYLTGDFLNYSTQTALWNTADAYIGFIGSGTHEFYMGGWDDASRMSFAWDTLELSGGGSLVFSGGAGSAIYVDNLILGADAIMDLNGIAIYYASLTDLGGSYYGGNVVNIASLPQGGNASVPEPSTLLLLGSGVAALFGWRRARGRLH